MPDHIQKNLSDQNVASMAVKLHEKSEIYTSNSFQHIRNSKSLQTDWPNTFSPTTREPGFSDKRVLAEFQRQLSCIIYPPSPLPKKKKKKKKKAHIDGLDFFQNPYCLFTSEFFRSTFTNPANLSRDIGNLFQSTMDMPGMLDHTNKNCIIKLYLPWMSNI